MVRKEDLPNNSVFGKVLSEIWALKVLLKQTKLARPPPKKHATTPKIQDIDELKLYNCCNIYIIGDTSPPPLTHIV